eukprot:COSAG02_NODE_49_length_45106_cov_298.436177_7_plen_425_part_00
MKSDPATEDEAAKAEARRKRLAEWKAKQAAAQQTAGISVDAPASATPTSSSVPTNSSTTAPSAAVGSAGGDDGGKPRELKGGGTEAELKQQERQQRLADWKAKQAAKKATSGSSSFLKPPPNKKAKAEPQETKAPTLTEDDMEATLRAALEETKRQEAVAASATSSTAASAKVQEEEMDLDDLMAQYEQASSKDQAAAREKEAKLAAEVAAGTYVDPDADKDRGEYAGDLRRENMKLHCYVCKKNGHTKKDCPNKRCRYCFEIGHVREDCEMWKKELERLKQEDKERKRKQQYAKKKFTKYQERSRALRDATGVHGFAALYRLLGLNDRKLASEKEIRRAYKRAALRWHPDKLKEGEDPEKAAEMFDSIKAAYDLLLEGMENGSVEGHTVFSAGELANVGRERKETASSSADSGERKVDPSWNN